MTSPLPNVADGTLTVVWSTGTDANTEDYDQPSYSRPPGLTISGIGRATHRAFGPPGTPSCDFAIPNPDSIYSPGGILGLFVNRGPEVTYDVDWGTDVLVDATDVLVDDPAQLVDGRSSYRRFTGNVDTAPQQIDNPASVQVHAQGRSALLLDFKPVIPLYEVIRADAWIRIVLLACGWPPDAISLDVFATTLLYAWANGDRSGSDLINAALNAEGVPACGYEDGNGTWVGEGRLARIDTTRSNTIQWRLFDGVVGAYNALVDDQTALVDDPNVLVDGPLDALLFHVVPSTWASNPDETLKSVKATVNVRTPSALPTKINEYGGPLVLGAGEVKDVEFTSSDPFKAAITPLAGTDYTVTAGTLASLTLLETSGQTVRVRITADAGGATVLGVTSNGIQLRATALPVTATVPVSSTVDVDLSAARFRPRDDTLNLWPEIAANDALQSCNNKLRRYQRPRPQMTVQVVNKDAAHLYMILHAQISDRVAIRHQRAQINSSFYIESMHDDLTTGGGLHRLTLNCEQVTDDTPSRFGTARFGFDEFSE